MSETPTPPPNGENQQAALRVLVQYVKDLSFENPQAPHSFQFAGQQADMDVQVDINARNLGENQFEVELTARATAKREEQTVFIVECVYAGVFELQNVPPEQVEPLLLIECPRQLFPFARRIIADSVRDGGYPPLLIDPIDFVALYRQRQPGAQGAVGNA